MTIAAEAVEASAPVAAPSRLVDLLLPAGPRRRYRLYVLVAIALYAVAWALAVTQAVVKDRAIDFLQADARGFYAYLPAMVINGNLDFSAATRSRDGATIGRGVLDETNSRGYVVNQWPPGVAMTLLPSFVLAHAVSWALFELTGSDAVRPDGFNLIYQAVNLAWVLAVVTASMIAIDRLLQRRWQVPGPAIAAAVLSFCVGTHYTWYVFREPFMAHAVGSAWVIFVVCGFDRIVRQLDDRRVVASQWAAVAFCTAMAIACRMTSVVLWPFFAYLMWRVVRAGLLPRFVKLLPVVVIACAPLIVQFVIVRQTTGQAAPTDVQSLGYRPHEGFYWTDPALVQSLLSSRHGLFSWTPILLLAAYGVMRYLTRDGGRRDPLVVCFVMSAGMLWYLNSAWYAWWFGWSFGNRGFLELGGLFVIGFAMCYRRWPIMGVAGRAGVCAVVALGLLVNYGLMAAKLTNRIEEQGYPLQWEKDFSQGAWTRF